MLFKKVLIAGLLAVSAVSHGQGWNQVRALPAGESIQIYTQQGKISCRFMDADAAVLTCERARRGVFRSPQTFAIDRTSVVSIRVPRKFLSALAGAALGVGAGIGVGFAAKGGNDGGDDANLLPALFGLLGGSVGAFVGAQTDFLGGRIIYRAL